MFEQRQSNSYKNPSYAGMARLMASINLLGDQGHRIKLVSDGKHDFYLSGMRRHMAIFYKTDDT